MWLILWFSNPLFSYLKYIAERNVHMNGLANFVQQKQWLNHRNNKKWEKHHTGGEKKRTLTISIHTTKLIVLLLFADVEWASVYAWCIPENLVWSLLLQIERNRIATEYMKAKKNLTTERVPYQSEQASKRIASATNHCTWAKNEESERKKLTHEWEHIYIFTYCCSISSSSYSAFICAFGRWRNAQSYNIWFYDGFLISDLYSHFDFCSFSSLTLISFQRNVCASVFFHSVCFGSLHFLLAMIQRLMQNNTVWLQCMVMVFIRLKVQSVTKETAVVRLADDFMFWKFFGQSFDIFDSSTG